MTSLLNNGPLSEHCGYPNGMPLDNGFAGGTNIYFKQNPEAPCALFGMQNGVPSVTTSYFIGTDWLEEGKTAIYVEPKLNKEGRQTDYLEMLFAAFSNAEAGDQLHRLFEMKADRPFITLSAKQDLLTPLLVLQFLKVTQRIVQKGLKRSYYTITQTLRSRVKGKLQVAQTLKSATLKNKLLDTVCSYSEFGFNSVENRVLKKTLLFVRRYLEHNKFLQTNACAFSTLLSFVAPPFDSVSDMASLPELRDLKLNPFYKEYREALELARLILKRFAFNIQTTGQEEIVTVPPFWIDMSLLFELYVLRDLRKCYGTENVLYQYKAGTEYPDMLIPGTKTVVDAKYKPSYKDSQKREDIRQLSGYARNIEVLKVFGHENTPESQLPVVPCWIIYPAELSVAEEAHQLICKGARERINGYVSFFKSAVSLPQQG